MKAVIYILTIKRNNIKLYPQPRDSKESMSGNVKSVNGRC